MFVRNKENWKKLKYICLRKQVFYLHNCDHEYKKY